MRRAPARQMVTAIAALTLLGGCYQSEGSGPGVRPTEPPPVTEPPVTEPPVAGPPVTAPPPTVAALPAIAGGSLAVSGSRVIVGDPDHATVWVLDLGSGEVQGLSLFEHDDPGRAVVDADGRVHVVLRGAGAILDIDPRTADAIARRRVCPAPRGIDFEPGADLLHVACATGELVSLPAAGGAITRTVVLDDDLRDVVFTDGRLYVSRFRSAELLTLDAGGAIARRQRPRELTLPGLDRDVTFAPNVAWRLRAMPRGGVAMLHQRAMVSSIDVERDGYMGLRDCPTGVVAPAITVFSGASARGAGLIAGPALLVDFVVEPDGQTFRVASAGTTNGDMLVPTGAVVAVSSVSLDEACAFPTEPGEFGDDPAVAVAFTSAGRLASYHRGEGTLRVGDVEHALSPGVAPNPGHELFHRVTLVGLACASCHPEGGEDGFTWDFQPVGGRRTQSLLGGLAGHEPFHWNGDQADMTAIMNVTFGQRMLGDFTPDDVIAIEAWLDTQATPPGSVRDAASVARGEALFAGRAGCADCHAGADLTNDENRDVGTGRDFQVPSLRGVMHRAPFFHDGCAPTLADVVDGACGTVDTHGRTSGLRPRERADLVAYLRSL